MTIGKEQSLVNTTHWLHNWWW